jgi:uncharacterized membrane protein
LLVGIVLRFYHYGSIPFTHDEFIALFLTKFDSFSDLIQKGVLPDVHPPLLEVFLFYWTKAFGCAEWVVKLPFTLFGLGAIIFGYLIGKKWYNETVGLITAAFIASMEYTVIYSQIARPYASGLFFSLAMVYYWTQIINSQDKTKVKSIILYILFASLSTYNHHFSLLFAAIVGLSGLFLVDRKRLLKYFIMIMAIPILYLPNVPIVLEQLKMGGVEDWLGKPHNDFILGYVAYLFHFSVIVGCIVVAISLFGWRHPQKGNRKWWVLSLVWFLLPLFIGFFYSRYVSAVLQYSCLIFSFPFLLFFLFGQVKKQRNAVNLIVVFAILTTNIFTLIYNRQYYHLFYTSAYQKLLTDNQKAHSKYNNIISLSDYDEKITPYYQNKLSSYTPFVRLNSFKSPQTLISFLKQQSKTADYLYIGALSSVAPETFAIVKDYFPYVQEINNYSPATTAVFSKHVKDSSSVATLAFDTLIFCDNKPYEISNDVEFSLAITLPLSKIISNENNFIDISVDVLPFEVDTSSLLVVELTSKGKVIYWTAARTADYIDGNEPLQYSKVYLSLKLSDIYLHYRDIELKTYVWNTQHSHFSIQNFKILRREGNPVIYGILEKLH